MEPAREPPPPKEANNPNMIFDLGRMLQRPDEMRHFFTRHLTLRDLLAMGRVSNSELNEYRVNALGHRDAITLMVGPDAEVVAEESRLFDPFQNEYRPLRGGMRDLMLNSYAGSYQVFDNPLVNDFARWFPIYPAPSMPFKRYVNVSTLNLVVNLTECPREVPNGISISMSNLTLLLDHFGSQLTTFRLFLRTNHFDSQVLFRTPKIVWGGWLWGSLSRMRKLQILWLDFQEVQPPDNVRVHEAGEGNEEIRIMIHNLQDPAVAQCFANLLETLEEFRFCSDRIEIGSLFDGSLTRWRSLEYPLDGLGWLGCLYPMAYDLWAMIPQEKAIKVKEMGLHNPCNLLLNPENDEPIDMRAFFQDSFRSLVRLDLWLLYVAQTEQPSERFAVLLDLLAPLEDLQILTVHATFDALQPRTNQYQRSTYLISGREYDNWKRRSATDHPQAPLAHLRTLEFQIEFNGFANWHCMQISVMPLIFFKLVPNLAFFRTIIKSGGCCWICEQIHGRTRDECIDRAIMGWTAQLPRLVVAEYRNDHHPAGPHRMVQAGPDRTVRDLVPIEPFPVTYQ